MSRESTPLYRNGATMPFSLGLADDAQTSRGGSLSTGANGDLTNSARIVINEDEVDHALVEQGDDAGIGGLGIGLGDRSVDMNRSAASSSNNSASTGTSEAATAAAGSLPQHATSQRISSGLAPDHQDSINMSIDDDTASVSTSAPPTPHLGGGDSNQDNGTVANLTPASAEGPSSGTVTPNPSHHYDLADQEIATFGSASVDDPLPPPPKDLAARQKGGAAPASWGFGSGEGIKPGSKRAPKSIKISAGVATTAKAPKTMIRRAAIIATKGLNGEEIQLPNNDWCDACLGKGHFLCCDGGCLRSFHFTCLDPPLDVDEVPDEVWYCKACRAQRDPPPPPPRGFFRELIYKIDCENPKAFSLTPEIKNLYKNVTTGAVGEYIDTLEHRPPSKITGRAVGQEDRDGYKLRDKSGKTLICYHCSETASIAKQRRIISCDFCDQHWHLDCLNPPLTGMPPPTRKWMCPIHTEHVLPKKRVPRNTTTIPVHARDVSNNGDILVIPRREPRTLDDDRYEEITVNRVRYQVPEETIILDFWGKSGAASGSLRGPALRRSSEVHRENEAGAAYASRNGSPDTVMSNATSASDADPPEVDRLGYSPYSRRYNPLFASTSKLSQAASTSLAPRSSSSFLRDTSALDGLALLAEVRYADLLASRGESSDGDVSMTTHEIAENRVGSQSPTSNKGKGRAESPESTSRNRTTATGSNGTSPSNQRSLSRTSALDLPIPAYQPKADQTTFDFTLSKLNHAKPGGLGALPEVASSTRRVSPPTGDAASVARGELDVSTEATGSAGAAAVPRQ